MCSSCQHWANGQISIDLAWCYVDRPPGLHRSDRSTSSAASSTPGIIQPSRAPSSSSYGESAKSETGKRALPRDSADNTTSHTPWSRKTRQCPMLLQRRPEEPMLLQRCPEELPPGDRRFAAKQKDRVYICDSCGKKVEMDRRSIRFNGQYVNLLDVRGRSVEELTQAYWGGEIDARWYCTKCHKRPNETLEDTLKRIEAVDTNRKLRTATKLRSGWKMPPGSRKR